MMRNWGITVTDEMDEAMKRLMEKHGATLSNIVRQAVAEYLTANGEPVNAQKARLQWGGKRKPRTGAKESG
jgi:predicted transcriptional regulator